MQRKACMGNNKIPSPCGKSGGFCDRFFLFPLQWGRGLRGGGINKALNSHRTYKCFPLTLALSPHCIRRPSVPSRERELYSIFLSTVYRIFLCPLHSFRFPLYASRCTLYRIYCVNSFSSFLNVSSSSLFPSLARVMALSSTSMLLSYTLRATG